MALAVAQACSFGKFKSVSMIATLIVCNWLIYTGIKLSWFEEKLPSHTCALLMILTGALRVFSHSVFEVAPPVILEIPNTKPLLQFHTKTSWRVFLEYAQGVSLWVLLWGPIVSMVSEIQGSFPLRLFPYLVNKASNGVHPDILLAKKGILSENGGGWSNWKVTRELFAPLSLRFDNRRRSSVTELTDPAKSTRPSLNLLPMQVRAGSENAVSY